MNRPEWFVEVSRTHRSRQRSARKQRCNTSVQDLRAPVKYCTGQLNRDGNNVHARMLQITGRLGGGVSARRLLPIKYSKSIVHQVMNDINIIITGDYNFRETTLSFDNTGLIVNGCRSAAVDVIFDSFSQFNLSQYNTLCNPYGNTLDLIFSNLNYLATDLCSNPLVPLDVIYHIHHQISTLNVWGKK